MLMRAILASFLIFLSGCTGEPNKSELVDISPSAGEYVSTSFSMLKDPKIRRAYGHPGLPILGVIGENSYEYSGPIKVDDTSYTLQTKYAPFRVFKNADGDIWLLARSYFGKQNFCWYQSAGNHFDLKEIGQVPRVLLCAKPGMHRDTALYRYWVLYELLNNAPSECATLFNRFCHEEPEFFFTEDWNDTRGIAFWLSFPKPPAEADLFREGLVALLLSTDSDDDPQVIRNICVILVKGICAEEGLFIVNDYVDTIRKKYGDGDIRIKWLADVTRGRGAASTRR